MPGIPNEALADGSPGTGPGAAGARNGAVPPASPGADPGAAGVPLGEFALLDVDRRRRTGVPEVVFGEGKTPEQIFALLAELRARDPEAPALATRCAAGVLDVAAGRFPREDVHLDRVAATVTVGALPPPRGNVLVVTAGTTDLKVARECAATLAALGVGATVLADVGVAGLGRLLSRLADLRAAECVVVAAGMDGALPSVVAGLVSAPVIGLPTSVGYGVAAGGLAAAASMLASCSPGLVVVNIDNGFGAAVHAAKIIRAVHR
jgi:pyridinium-3,5-biscarboxylic acid mononucleotide synthase